jgi:hypothetical protein
MDLRRSIHQVDVLVSNKLTKEHNRPYIKNTVFLTEDVIRLENMRIWRFNFSV